MAAVADLLETGENPKRGSGAGDIKLTPYQTLLRYYERLQSAYGWTVQEVDETDAGILLDQLLVTALVRDQGCQKFIEDVM